MDPLPVLYSFRRCPYAMRARMAIVREGFRVELREVVLRDRPPHMMEISPKGTVPVLLLPDETVIEESLEIMQHVLEWSMSDEEAAWVERNDGEFKHHLDRYKYPNRYEGVKEHEHRALAAVYLHDLNARLGQHPLFSTALSDALFPFVRQFANHDRAWFDGQPWPHLHVWLKTCLGSAAFERCMVKVIPWMDGQVRILFPEATGPSA